MKGISHFISGVAAATFIEKAVNMAAYDHSLILVLGGIFGILPDTLDFKFAKFFEKFDYEVDPHPDNMDPQKIAETVAAAINDAYENGRQTNLMLHTVRLGADLWRQYSVYFDNENMEVVVKIGPVVNTSKLAYPGTEYEGKSEGRAKIKCKVLHNYDSETYIDIFSGPSFTFEKMEGKDMVEALFIPWHRKWSHSLTLGAFFGLLGWLFLGKIYGLVITLGFWTHVIEDQFGFMGSNLFWPITKKRFQGLKWMRSADAWPNFATVWISCLLIIYNLNRFAPYAKKAFNMSWVEFFGYTFFVPVVILKFIGKVFETIYAEDTMELEIMETAEKNKEMLSENEETVES
jgi:membrane-bound metal-dependent hydrolase YbcI (DUF457 family)